MRVTTSVRKLVASGKIIICLALIPSIASAEYYFWAPEPVQNIVEYHGSKHGHYWSVRHGYYYDDCFAFPAYVAVPVYVRQRVRHYTPPRKQLVKQYRRTHHRSYSVHVYRPCCCYDPDLATGDDNACVNPNMDIDY